MDNVYAIVSMDAIHYKVMDDKNRPVTRAIDNVLRINKEGYKKLLGIYISKSEGANFWLSCLSVSKELSEVELDNLEPK